MSPVGQMYQFDGQLVCRRSGGTILGGPPVSGGGGPPPDNQPTGPGIVRYQDLFVSGDTLSGTLNRLTTPMKVSFPAGVFEMVDFADQGKFGCFIPAKCMGLLGSGIDATIFQIRPGSSTKASLVPTTGSNPYYVFRTTTSPANGFVASGWTICGTEQPIQPNTSRPHDYGGINLDHINAPTMTDCKVVGTPGSAHVNPGETFAINDFGCTNAVYTRIECDGRIGQGTGSWYVPSFFSAGDLVMASPWGANSSTNPTHHDCYFHHTYASMPTWYQTVNATTYNIRSEHCGTNNIVTTSLSGHGLNHERISGVFHHYNPIIIHDSLVGGSKHTSFMSDQANIDTLYFHGMVAGTNFDIISGSPNFGEFSVTMHFNGANPTYMGNPSTQKLPPHLYHLDGTSFIEDHGSVPGGSGSPTTRFVTFG